MFHFSPECVHERNQSAIHARRENYEKERKKKGRGEIVSLNFSRETNTAILILRACNLRAYDFWMFADQAARKFVSRKKIFYEL